ncbi:hypothetical protein [Streptomyces sirii]|uniref:hypothetical protein n=1 Tax=Streptomyces sirii TaxID=3127701 RepID=UPI003D36C945
MAHQLPAQRRAQQHLAVARQPRDLPTSPRLDYGQRRPGPFDLAGRGGQQRAGGDRVGAEHRGDLVGGEVMAHRELQRLALLGGGARGLRPGQRGQFPLPPLGVAGGGGARRAGRCAVRGAGAVRGGDRSGARLSEHGAARLSGGPGPLGEPAQTGPAGQRVEPGAVHGRIVGAPAAAVLREREHLAEDRRRRVVVAQDGQAVREQPVQIRLIAVVAFARAERYGPLGGMRPAPAVAARPVCAGGVRGVLGPAAHHPGDGRGMMKPGLLPRHTFNPYG